ncbi:DUF2786 domain-containing protein [Francisellaceae bacterium]|nr:DUF2786 domain-containing protein [Francisellaceae bacterium]
MREKHKDKIKKLLELSLSDNENEAGIALKQAMSLMNRHNITKDEVYGQSMVSEQYDTRYYRIPGWYCHLYNYMAKLSGCFCVYRQGDSSRGTKGHFQLVGREHDVENATYLITFLSREIERHVKAYKAKLAQEVFVYNIAHQVKSYRMGFIQKVYDKMSACQQQFFAEENQSSQKVNSTELVCVDTEIRRNEAQLYYVNDLGQDFRQSASRSRYYDEDMDAGSNDANDLEIRNAVYEQSNQGRISYSN